MSRCPRCRRYVWVCRDDPPCEVAPNEFNPAPGWLMRDMKRAEAEMRSWPEWMREAARFAPDAARKEGR